jgi:cytochrome c oxidase subunit 2
MENMLKRFLLLIPAVWLGVIAAASSALADGYVARSKPWQMWLQEPMSPSAQQVHDLNLILLWIEIAIVIFVLAILGYCLVRFSEKNNPVPSKTTHNTSLEVIWTAVPILILIGITIPSMKVLYFADHTPNAEMTLKVKGNQWFWSYEYPDHGGVTFDSVPIQTEDLKPGQPRLLSVDNPVYLPAETNVRLLLGSNDVIHNWAIPSLSVKLDTTPGRVNETWVRINKPGDYYGMCSELCGVNHGFMPIHIKALPKAEFAAWVEKAKKQFGSIDTEVKPVRLAKATAR